MHDRSIWMTSTAVEHSEKSEASQAWHLLASDSDHKAAGKRPIFDGAVATRCIAQVAARADGLARLVLAGRSRLRTSQVCRAHFEQPGCQFCVAPANSSKLTSLPSPSHERRGRATFTRAAEGSRSSLCVACYQR